MVFLLCAAFRPPRALQEGLKRPHRWSNRIPSRRPIGPRHPRGLPGGRKRFQDAQGSLQEASPEGAKEQN
eukprot:5672359-Pyramimonas_sp.AAC.1